MLAMTFALADKLRPLVLAVIVTAVAMAAPTPKRSPAVGSPDKHLLVVVDHVRNPRLDIATESVVTIRDSRGTTLQEHDFTSPDGEHGYDVDGMKWTPDSQYCVFRLRSSGGHSPMFAPIIFWSRKTTSFYSLNDYTADQIFTVRAPAKVKASTWPGMRPATIILSELKAADVTELKAKGE